LTFLSARRYGVIGVAIRSNTEIHIARKKPFSTERASEGRLAKLKIATIRDGYAYGRKRAEYYDPFVNYYTWKERRDSTQPPHLIFANLPEEEAAAKHFLETYGALTETYITDTDAETDWGVDAQDAQLKLTDPEAYYRKHRVFVTGTISAGDPGTRLWPGMPKSLHREDLVRVNLSEFWCEQEAFLLVYRLWEALENRRGDVEIRALFRGAVGHPSRIRSGAFSFPAPLLADLQSALKLRHETNPIQALADRVKTLGGSEARWAAWQLILKVLNRQVARVRPAVQLEAGSISRTWQCRTLLEALYMMFFLDLAQGRRILHCNNCGILFAESKRNVKFCGQRCETRHRVREWWRRHGKEYRAKKKRNLQSRRREKTR
jgi:hypothetical protein